MPKYDAFGREIGEDTLSEWRSEDSRDEAREAIPVERPAEPDAPEPEPELPEPEPVLTVGAAEPARRAAEPHASERTIRVEMPRPGGRRRRPRVVSRLIILLVVLGVGA